MAKIGLEGIEFYAYHGYYDQERSLGGRYMVDIFIDIYIPDDIDDKIADTYNYERLYTICQKHMDIEYQLLETLAQNIVGEVKKSDSRIEKVYLKLAKISPPIKGNIAKAIIKLRG